MKGGKERGMEERREGGRERVVCIGKASHTTSSGNIIGTPGHKAWFWSKCSPALRENDII
jgi:hypothetical protein